MSANLYRTQLEGIRRRKVDAESKAGDYRAKESTKRNDAAKARAAATRATNRATAESRLREAERAERDAASAASQAASWQARAAKYAKEEIDTQRRLASAERLEADQVERKRKRDQQHAERRVAADRMAIAQLAAGIEPSMLAAARPRRAPTVEKLRILILGAGPAGDLRVGREQKRIRAAVESALHRDLVELDVRPAATADDLLDGITKFRPHIVHFSGHGDHDLVVFEEERDELHEGAVVSATAFAAAVTATDDPPVLVLLNSCNSATQIDALVASVVPFAIGMSDEIEDSDAIAYAAQFYAATANGQSVLSSHLSAQAALELAGLDSASLPVLATGDGADPAGTILVRPPDSEAGDGSMSFRPRR